MSTDPSVTPLIYPQAMLFKVFKEDRRLHHGEPKKPLELFGKGEAGAVVEELTKQKEVKEGGD